MTEIEEIKELFMDDTGIREDADFVGYAPVVIPYLLGYICGLEKRCENAEGNVKTRTTALKTAKENIRELYKLASYGFSEEYEIKTQLAIADIDLVLGEK